MFNSFALCFGVRLGHFSLLLVPLGAGSVQNLRILLFLCAIFNLHKTCICCYLLTIYIYVLFYLFLVFFLHFSLKKSKSLAVRQIDLIFNINCIF